MSKKIGQKNTMIHLTLLFFMILSAFLMTIGTFVILQTKGSMDHIFSIAKPPHFLQMHTGEIDREEIEQFADSQEMVDKSEIVEMLNIEGAGIWYQKKGKESVSMAESMLDNGFVKQTEFFDYLLDLDNHVIKQEDGGIGVPISYMEQYDMAIGDTITIQKGDFSRTYEIRNFVRDAQMASTMASSVRFLLSDNDFMDLKEHAGELEYLIEFRLKDSANAGKFQKLYEDSGMPVNGQGITYPLIKLINFLASGLLAGAMFLVSIILILIAALNLRFTMLAVLEEEVREIGVMKAVGISNKDIKNRYLKRYRILAVIGCVIGFVFGIFANRMFTESIRVMFGEQPIGITEILISVAAVLFVYWFMMHLCKKILKRIGKITVVGSLVYGETGIGKKASAKAWLLIVIVFFLATNIMLIPMNLIHTVQDKKFASRMGNADSDLCMEIQANDDAKEKCGQLIAVLEKDSEIEKYGVFSTNRCETLGGDEEESLLVQWGDYLEFPIPCIEGDIPKNEGEIALSYLNGKKLGKNVGDSIEITMGEQKITCKVTGIYQDMTSGGYTAKAYSSSIPETQNYTIFVNCKDKNKALELSELYSERYPFAKILPMEEFTSQTFGSVISTFAGAAYVAVVVAMVIGILITVLFLKLQIAKEYSKIAILRVLGFSLEDLTAWYFARAGIASLIGIMTGILWCNTGCNMMVSMALNLANSGIAEFKFVVNPVFNFILCPVVLLLAVLLTTYLCTREMKDYELMKMISE